MWSLRGAAVLVLTLSGACAIPREPGAPARLLAGAADTVVINHRGPTSIPMRAFDAADRTVPVTGVRYSRSAGDSLDVTSDGTVTCTRRGDATVRASLDAISTDIVLRCRPVQSLRVSGPIQFDLGDSVQGIPLQALGPDGETVELLAGTVTSSRSNVAQVESGLRVSAHAVGVSLLSIAIGDERARVGVHVYEPLRTLDGIRADQKLVSLPLRLESGEVRRWPLPVGQWMFTMMPYEDEITGLRLRIEGAVCVKTRLTPRRIVCESKTGGTIIVYHRSTTSAPPRKGSLLVRRVNS